MTTYFRLFVKKKMVRSYKDAWVNLQHYCRSLLETRKEHHYKLVLEKEANQPLRA